MTKSDEIVSKLRTYLEEAKLKEKKKEISAGGMIKRLEEMLNG